MRRLESYFRFPEPWSLDEEWLERLEVSEAHRRRYGHLSLAERRKLEADRLLIEEYVARDLLRSGLPKMGLMNRMFEEIDNIWLREGKGRAVDFRHALYVLDTYATYRRWAEGVQRASQPLNVLVPYWIENLRWHEGPGLLGIQVNLQDPSLGELGDVRWGLATLRIQDFQVKKGVSREEFAKNPPAYTEFYHRVVGIRMNGVPDLGTFGLGRLIHGYCDQTGRSKEFPTLVGWNLLSHDITVGQKTCNAADIQGFLNVVGELHFPHRIGDTTSPIRFEVSPSLMEIRMVGGPDLIDPRVLSSR